MYQLDLKEKRIIVYLEGNLQSWQGKTGLAVLRSSPHHIIAVIDSKESGSDLEELTGIERKVPIVDSLERAIALGGDTLLIGLATTGGILSDKHRPIVENAVARGLTVVNGLHEQLSSQFQDLQPGQEIYDVRVPKKESFSVGFGRAAQLSNRRVLTVGTDMAIGKMTTCLALHQECLSRGMQSKFFATGQTGIIIEGQGIPLDAIPVDFAAGAVEQGVCALSESECDVLFVEGQGSILNPASTATLPLIRGTMPTDLILVHKAGQTHIRGSSNFPIPPLSQVVDLYETLCSAGGLFQNVKVKAIALNTQNLTELDALKLCTATEVLTGLPCEDPVRFGPGKLVNALTRSLGDDIRSGRDIETYHYSANHRGL